MPVRRSSGQEVIERPEREPVNWMNDFVLNLSKAGDLVVNACAGMLGTAKACV